MLLVYRTVYEWIFIFVRIEYRILFASAKLWTDVARLQQKLNSYLRRFFIFFYHWITSWTSSNQLSFILSSCPMILLQLLLTNTNIFVGRSLFQRGGRGSRKFQPEAEILGIFSIEVAPNLLGVIWHDKHLPSTKLWLGSYIYHRHTQPTFFWSLNIKYEYEGKKAK